jgi:hypothetical protein
MSSQTEFLDRPSTNGSLPRINASEKPTYAAVPTIGEVRYRCSEHFLAILRHLSASLLVSTYQAGKVAVIAAGDTDDNGLRAAFTV